MNVTVINIKDLFKYLVVLITSIVVIVSATRFFYNKSISIEKKDIIKDNNKSFYLTCLKTTIPMIDYKQETTFDISNKESVNKSNILTKLLGIQLGLIDNIEAKNDKIAENNNEENNENTENTEKSDNTEENNQEIELAKTNLQTQEVTENNIVPSYTNIIDNIAFKNQSSYEITEDLVNSPFNLNNKTDVIIFHTHTCESYTQTENYSYTPSGEFRTTDLDCSVARVGDELDKQLTAYGFNVIHDTTYHDYPAYTGSYDRSLNTVKSILEDNPSTEIIIDLHRDAVGSSAEYGPSVIIGDEKVAQMMFVIGTDGGGLYHPNWRENFKLAISLQRKANELYPGLFRPIILRDSRYNHHLANGAFIVEVGATGNTMEECLGSMKYLAKVMSEVIK